MGKSLKFCELELNLPATKENKYVLIVSVGANWCPVNSPISLVLISGAPQSTFQSLGAVMFKIYVAFKLGWSKQGKRVRARSGTNRVYRKSSFLLRDNSPALNSIVMLFSPFSKYSEAMARCSCSWTMGMFSPLASILLICFVSSLKSRYTGFSREFRKKCS